MYNLLLVQDERFTVIRLPGINLSSVVMLEVASGMGKETKARTVIAMIHEYIDDNLHGDTSLTKLADVVGMNPSYLSRFYKQKMRMGLHEYIMSVKLAKAVELLQYSEKKIYHIGREVGFDSPHYFCHFFKKHMKLSPQQFREVSFIDPLPIPAGK